MIYTFYRVNNMYNKMYNLQFAYYFTSYTEYTIECIKTDQNVF